MATTFINRHALLLVPQASFRQQTRVNVSLAKFHALVVLLPMSALPVSLVTTSTLQLPPALIVALRVHTPFKALMVLCNA